MSHVQIKRLLPNAAPAHGADHKPQSRAHVASPELSQLESKPSRALTAARRVFNTIRLSAHATNQAEERIAAQAQGRASDGQR